MGTSAELSRLARELKGVDSAGFSFVVFDAERHAPYVGSWVARIAKAGQFLGGIHLPSEWPDGCGVLSLTTRDDRLQQDEAFVCGASPLRTLSMLQIWATPGQWLRLTLRLPEQVDPQRLAMASELRPYAIQIHATQNGTARKQWARPIQGT